MNTPSDSADGEDEDEGKTLGEDPEATYDLITSSKPTERLFGRVFGVRPSRLTIKCNKPSHAGEEVFIFSFEFLMIEGNPKFIGLLKETDSDRFSLEVFLGDKYIGKSPLRALRQGATFDDGLRFKYSFKCSCNLGDSQRSENFRNTLTQVVRIGISENRFRESQLVYSLQEFILLISSR